MLKQLWARLFADREPGQAMVMFAVLASTMMLTMGLAVEGGRVFVEYRRMQAAADMAALVGAQDLPCKVANSTCITTAETDACTYATKNGFSGCTPGSVDAPSADVPPHTCSPYSFLDYGNNATNPCPSATGRVSAATTQYFFIEVQLSQQITIPIFNKTANLYVHAVARHGVDARGDYAVSILDQSAGSFSMGGSATVTVQGSTFSNGTISVNGNPSLETCKGGWSVSGNQIAPSQLNSYSTGTPGFSPPGCYNGSVGAGSPPADSPVNFTANLPPIDDPYATTPMPPYQSSMGSWPNCTMCQQDGWWVDLSSNIWKQGGAPSGTNIELFPGVYDTLSLGVGDSAYLNPGVYTFKTAFNPLHGGYCVYGAPACDNSNCGTGDPTGGTNTNWLPGDTAGNQWFYQCSPWGFWDPSAIPNRPPAVCATCGPVFYNESTGGNSTVPMNGITINLPLSGISQHGNAGSKPGDTNYIAFPNPCPGTGTYTSGSPGQVQFPYGTSDPTAQFNYSTKYGGSLPTWLHGLTQSPSPATGLVYPSADLSLLGECPNSLMDWPNQFGVNNNQGQHLHFAIFARNDANTPPDSTLDISLNGAAAENWYGILYAPNSTVSLNGAGKGAGGPPWIEGQIIAWDASFSGNATIDVVYRPCSPGSVPCGTGPGSALVQ